MLAWRRLAAFGIDWCLFAVWACAVALVVWLAQGGRPAWLADPWLSQLAGAFVTTLPLGAYFVLCEGGACAATVGKRAFGLRVQAENGRAPGRRRALLRTAVKLLPWELGHLQAHQMLAAGSDGDVAPWVIAVGIAAMLGEAWFVVGLFVGRTPYDRLAGTRVVRA